MKKSSKYALNSLGYIKAGPDTFTYQIGETLQEAQELFSDSIQSTGRSNAQLVKVDKYKVFPAGSNNLEPNEQKEMIASNRLLPELIEKQIRMLYGTGPVLYITRRKGKDVWKEFVEHQEIEEWLDSWLENGLADDYKTYFNKAIRSYYYDEGVFTKWRMTVGMRVGINKVAGLEHVSNLRARLATTADTMNRTDYEDSEFNYVIIGNWMQPGKEYKVYNRFDYTTPFSHPTAISYSKNPSHGEEIYAYNVFFRGIRAWVIGSNRTPEYINSFLENAISARLHIIIPNAWVQSKVEMLKDMCSTNSERKSDNQELLVIKFSDSDIMEVGTEYHEGLIAEYTTKELRKLANYLSGAGKNQGKLYASYSFTNNEGQEERWKIEEIPNKSKDYIEAHTTYDKRADEVITSAKGIDSSISNISKDGVISKSGADAHYNYMIYLNGLTIPEDVVCRDINYAIKLNFPEAYKTGIRLGFYRSAIEKQQNVSEDNRLTNTQV